MADSSLIFNLLGRDRVSPSLKKLRAEVDKTDKALTGFNDKAEAGAAKFAKLVNNVSTLSTVLNTVAAIGPAAASTAGSLALIPGVLAVGAAVMGTFKLGADGLKKAGEALAPTLDKLKGAVSKSFASSLAPAVKNLNEILPKTHTGFQAIATSVGGVATQFTAMLKQPANMRSLNGILMDSARTTQNLGRAAAPLGQAFLDVASVGSSMFREMTTGAGSSAASFAKFIREAKESGKIRGWIQGGIDSIKEIGHVLADVGHIVVKVFGYLREGGVGATGVLKPAIAAVKEFVDSPVGHEAFVALGKAITIAGTAISQVLLAALRAIGPAVPDLARAFGNLANSVLPIVIKGIEILGPLLQHLAKFLADNVDWLGPLALGMYAVSKAFTVVTAAVKFLGTSVMGHPLIAFAAVVATTAGLIIGNWDEIKARVGQASSSMVQNMREGQSAVVAFLNAWTTQKVAGNAIAATSSALTTVEQHLQAVKTAQLDYDGAVRDFGSNSPQAVSALGALRTATQDAERAQRDAANATKSHEQALRELQDQALASANADLQLRQSRLGLAQAQESYTAAVKRTGPASTEAQAASLQLEGAYIRAAESARAKAAAQLVDLDATQKSKGETLAYTNEIVQMAIAAGRNAPPSLRTLAANLSNTELSALSAAAAASGLRTKVLALPDGRTVVVAVDDHGTPVINGIEWELAQLRDKTVRVNLVETVIRPGGPMPGTREWTGGHHARGGVTGRGDVWVGEQGPELVRLPRFSSVTPAGQSATAARRSGGDGGGAAVIEIKSGGSRLDDLLVEILRKAIRVQGGNVQSVLGG